jgi:outer membrane PBP1 activator LpoA protein
MLVPVRLRLISIVLTLSLVAGCATLGTTDDADNQAAASAEAIYDSGEFRAAAQAFVDLARSDPGGRHHYRLRAAEALREEGDLAAAQQQLVEVKRKKLRADDAARYDLLDAEIALVNGDAAHSLSLLSTTDPSLPPALALRRLELMARAQAAAGDAFGAAATRAQFDRNLEGADREHNRAQILETLGSIDTAALKQRALALDPSDPLRPWIERTLRKQGMALPLATLRPSRPVGTVQAGADDDGSREGYRPSRHVALLLPIGGPLKTAAAAVRDGFFAAFFGDRSSTSDERGEVKIYDSGNTADEAFAAYQRAVAEGADRVVGPLTREAVGLLFEQGRLPVPLLALNQSDNGATPPPGSISFGLLPDAEGAQAAEHMVELGLREAVVIAATDDWAERATLAFRAQYESLGGVITGEGRLRDGEVNLSALIHQTIGAVAPAGGAGVFISMRPQQARLLLPQLKLAGVTRPVFATSHVYSGSVNPGLDRDLDGLEFCDAPWLFDATAGLPPRDEIARSVETARGAGARLFALGLDAYSLLPYMDWLGTHPDSYLPGATGQLAADSFGRVHRLLTWARFENGVAHPALGGLSISGAAP